MAGVCALSEADDPELLRYLVARVNELIESPCQQVRDLGLAYQIASRFSVFSDKIWTLLEHDSKQSGLNIYPWNGSSISLAQLGKGAAARVAAWPSKRRVEFVRELSDNGDNYDFLVHTAHTEPDHAVQAEAIAALFWHFPASDAPVQAWLIAPLEVQTDEHVLGCIEYALEQGHAGDAVRERFCAIGAGDVSERVQLKLALASPSQVTPRALDVVFAHLEAAELRGNFAPLVCVARSNAPERLLDLAQQLVVSRRYVPDWASQYVRGAPAEVRAYVFERAWATLQEEPKNLPADGLGSVGLALIDAVPQLNYQSAEVVGPLANRSQTERSVAAWLRYSADQRVKPPGVSHARASQVRYLLAHAPGSDLLSVVMERGATASFDEAAELLDLLKTRLGRDHGGESKEGQWLPTSDEVRRLIEVFGEKPEAAQIRQDKVFVLLISKLTD